MGILDAIKDFFAPPSVTPKAGPSNPDVLPPSDPEKILSKNTYSVTPNYWYRAKPYGFKLNRRDKSSIVMFLPINPNNLTIATNFATNIIPTLYGTVEEHSEIRYYDIVIEGTTGMAPKFVKPYIVNNGEINDSTAYSTTKTAGRSSAALSQSLNAGGFFSKTLSAVNQIGNKITDLAGSPTPYQAFDDANSGYVAFHNLYRTLHQYKNDTAGVTSTETREKHPLTFFNYKDGNQYDVAITRFDLRRTAENPMLYFYSIHMRGYNLRSLQDQDLKDDLNQRNSDLGLNGVSGSSVLGDIKKKSSSVKSIIGAAVGGINILGR